MSYCVVADVVPFLPAGQLPNPARTASGSASGDYVESDGHGLASGAEVVLHAEVNGTLPAPLVAGTTYYALVLSASRFKLAATSGGAAIGLTTDGANFGYTSPLPWDAWMAWGSEQVDSFLPSHVIPLDPILPYPPIVITAAAELAAMRGLQATGGASIDLGARIDAIGARIARWAKTIPIRGTTVQRTQPSNLAVSTSSGAYDPRGWGGTDDTRLP